MRKKLTIGLILGIVLMSFLLIKDPLQMFFDFLIGGIVPGLNISLGFVPSIAFIVLIIWVINKWVNELRHHMIVQQTNLNKVEAKRREFKDSNSNESTKNKSVISARTAKQSN